MTHEAKSSESEHGALTLIRENSEAAAADRALSIASPSAHDRRQTTRARIYLVYSTRRRATDFKQKSEVGKDRKKVK